MGTLRGLKKKDNGLRQAEKAAQAVVKCEFVNQVLSFLHACARMGPDFTGSTLKDLLLLGTGTEEAFNMLRDKGGDNAVNLYLRCLDFNRSSCGDLVSALTPVRRKEIETIMEEEIGSLDRESALQELLDKGIILKIDGNFFPKGGNFKWEKR